MARQDHPSPLSPARRAFREAPSLPRTAGPARGGKKKPVLRGLGHGRRNWGFMPDEPAQGSWNLDPAALPQDGFTVQVAPRGFLTPLLEELGDRTITVMGRLVLTRGQGKAHWAQTAWLAPAGSLSRPSATPRASCAISSATGAPTAMIRTDATAGWRSSKRNSLMCPAGR